MPTESSTPLDKFELFPKLPVELQLKVWKFAMPGPRLVELRFKRDRRIFRYKLINDFPVWLPPIHSFIHLPLELTDLDSSPYLQANQIRNAENLQNRIQQLKVLEQLPLQFWARHSPSSWSEWKKAANCFPEKKKLRSKTICLKCEDFLLTAWYSVRWLWFMVPTCLESCTYTKERENTQNRI